ncbi:hypothetical protein LFM09_16720 [Lentzea alba]|uniref:hypothetical protein n=1 Tax=Lentzea alba TaxID=2714351 RepID=UPI0039BF9E2A
MSPFTAKAVDGGIEVHMTDELAKPISGLLEELELQLGRGWVSRALKFRYRFFGRPLLMRQMFPNAGPSWLSSSLFRNRHRRVLGDPRPAKRLRARFRQPMPWVLPLDEVDDWVMVMGQLRALYRVRKGATPAEVATFTAFQCQIVSLADPEVADGCPEHHQPAE